MRADKAIKLHVSHEAFVWGAQASKTQAELNSNLHRLDVVNPSAAKYLRNLNPYQWDLHPNYLTTKLYAWRTTNFVKSEQARSLKLKPQRLLPYEYFRTYSKILMCECWRRLQQSQQWEESGRLVTHREDSKLQSELKHLSNYSVAFSSAEICYVFHTSSTHETNLEVNLSTPSCPCPMWNQFCLPCRRLFAALDAAGKLDSAMVMFDRCYITEAYKEHLRPI